MKQTLLTRIINMGVVLAFVACTPISLKVEGTKPFEASGMQPFANNNGLIPPESQYSGPMFQLSHSWPEATPTSIKDPPWVKAIGGEPIITCRTRKPMSKH